MKEDLASRHNLRTIHQPFKLIEVMKKNLFIFALILTFLVTSTSLMAKPLPSRYKQQSNDIEDIISLFKGKDNVTIVNLPKSLIQMGLQSSNAKDGLRLAKQIESIKILEIEKASKELQNHLQKLVNNLQTKGYSAIIENNQKDENNHILVKENNNQIESIVILSIDKQECSLVCIEGQILNSDLMSIINGIQTD